MAPLTKTCVIIEARLYRVDFAGNFSTRRFMLVGGAAVSAENDPTGGPEFTNNHLSRDMLKLRLVRQAEARMFQPGDPIRLSKLGESRIKRAPSKTGRVVRGTGSQRTSQNAVRVRFDGMKYPVSLHLSYIELLDAKDTTNEGEMMAR